MQFRNSIIPIKALQLAEWNFSKKRRQIPLQGMPQVAMSLPPHKRLKECHKLSEVLLIMAEKYLRKQSCLFRKKRSIIRLPSHLLAAGQLQTELGEAPSPLVALTLFSDTFTKVNLEILCRASRRKSSKFATDFLVYAVFSKKRKCTPTVRHHSVPTHAANPGYAAESPDSCLFD